MNRSALGVVLLSASLLLSGCQDNRIEDAVRDELVDGESARFRDIVKCSNDGGMHNGLVNSKNRYGGYAGNVVFFYDGAVAYLPGDSEYSAMGRRCFGS